MSHEYSVTIGQDDKFYDINDGDADDNSYITGTGYIKADWVDNSSIYPNNSAIAIANANPGASIPSGAAQVITAMEFSGSGSQSATFTTSIDYDVELVCAGGSGKLTTQAFAYDLNAREYLEIEKIRPASNSGNVVQLWRNSGTEEEDITVNNITAGDRIAVGARVIVAASAALISDAYADAWPDTGGSEHYVQLNSVDVNWL